MTRYSFRFAVLLAFLAVAGMLSVELGFLPLDRAAHLRYSVHGLDISHHQDAIDWDAVDTDHIDFVFMKATEGVDWIDPRFDENWAGAQKSGLARGAYHYFRFCQTGAEQAAHFLETVPPEPNTLPPAIDVEYTGNCGRRRSAESIREELRSFVDIVADAHDRPPIIYADSDAYRRIISGHFRDVPLWFPTLGKEPEILDDRKWTFWQHNHEGQIDGIRGHVDLNVFAGSRWAFGRLVD